MLSSMPKKTNLLEKTRITSSTYSPEGQNVSFGETENGYTLKTPKDEFSLGKWLLYTSVRGEAVYDFSVDCYGDVTEEDVYVILTQYTEDGKMPIREHAHTAVREGECLRFSDKVETACGVTHLCVELWLKGEGCSVCWQGVSLYEGDAILPRKVRVAPVQMKSIGKTIEEQLQNVSLVLDKAGRGQADIVILGEAIYGKGLGLLLKERAENENGEMASLVRKKAKQYRMYAVYNTVEQEGDAFYNTSYLFGRSGEVVGKYRKTHLPVTELEEGLTSGKGYPVFDLDFGRVGLLVCYDQFFPRTAEALAMAGAELICISSIGDMSHCSFSRAMENGVYVAISGANNENPHGFGATRVIDPLGRLLSHTDENLSLALCEIDLSKRVRRFWMSTGPALSDVHDDYRFEKNSRSFE